MLFFNNKGNKELDEILKTMKVNLENNYKDLALDAFGKYKAELEKLYNGGALSDKVYKKYKNIEAEYTERLKGYHH